MSEFERESVNNEKATPRNTTRTAGVSDAVAAGSAPAPASTLRSCDRTPLRGVTFLGATALAAADEATTEGGDQLPFAFATPCSSEGKPCAVVRRPMRRDISDVSTNASAAFAASSASATSRVVSAGVLIGRVSISHAPLFSFKSTSCGSERCGDGVELVASRERRRCGDAEGTIVPAAACEGAELCVRVELPEPFPPPTTPPRAVVTFLAVAEAAAVSLADPLRVSHDRRRAAAVAKEGRRAASGDSCGAEGTGATRAGSEATYAAASCRCLNFAAVTLRSTSSARRGETSALRCCSCSRKNAALAAVLAKTSPGFDGLEGKLSPSPPAASLKLSSFVSSASSSSSPPCNAPSVHSDVRSSGCSVGVVVTMRRMASSASASAAATESASGELLHDARCAFATVAGVSTARTSASRPGVSGCAGDAALARAMTPGVMTSRTSAMS